MNRILSLILSIVAAVAATAQTFETQSISMQPGYTHQVFFDFENGIPSMNGEVANNNWSLAFMNEPMSASVFLNGGNGVEVYQIDGLSPVDFDSIIDTTGYASAFTRLYPDYTTWEGDPFTSNATGFPDYGWGDYDMVTHVVTGDQVYLLKAIDETFYKFTLIDRASGEWRFRYSTLDNAIDVTDSIDGGASSDLITYYDLQNQVSLDREPDQTDWDITFTRYLTTLNPGVYYPVSGVLANMGVEVAEARNIAPADATLDTADLNPVVNEIGDDWKNFNMTTFQWELPDSLSYFVRSQEGDVYHLYFTSFEGTSTGDLSFEYAKVEDANTSITDRGLDLATFAAMPNPTTGRTDIVLDAADAIDDGRLTVSTSTGQIVLDRPTGDVRGLTAVSIETADWAPGIYFVSVRGARGTSTLQLSVR